jgi:hypothetical protein
VTNLNDEEISKENWEENKEIKGIYWLIAITFLIAATALTLAIICYLWIGNIPGA